MGSTAVSWAVMAWTSWAMLPAACPLVGDRRVVLRTRHGPVAPDIEDEEIAHRLLYAFDAHGLVESAAPGADPVLPEGPSALINALASARKPPPCLSFRGRLTL